MRQLLQNVSTGEITVEDVPGPAQGPASLLVVSRYSLLSAGTERAALEVGRASLVGKARARPDLAMKVFETVRAEGPVAAYAKVRGRLDEPRPLGYSLSGIVLETSDGAPAGPGELVACGGVGHAAHAEVVSVPRTLCARVPLGVAAEDAAYATVAAIALHGVRLAEIGLGGVTAVIGLGLVGQITLQLVSAAGGVAMGVDPDPGRVEMAQGAGFFATTDSRELEAEAARVTERRGADAVLVTAASRSSAPLAVATAVARERATVCIVGDVAIKSPRAPLYAKELRLIVSRSYGPGRYDPTYEESGIDYPPGYVRWTEGRNIEEALRLMAVGSLRPSRLTTHVFDFEDAPAAYALLESNEPSLGILLRYPERRGSGNYDRSTRLERRSLLRRAVMRDRPAVGVIGAGAFARTVLMPALARHADIAAVATATGPSAHASARRFGARLATTDFTTVLDLEELDAVVIATRHDTHAEYAARALQAGKSVFVEKPLALDLDGLARVEEAATAADSILMVGFNRRFAPLAAKMQEALCGRGPLLMSYRVSAGRLPRSHWTHDPLVGGGRIVGEVCHFVDFATFLCGTPPVDVSATAVRGSSEPPEDDIVATVTFADGSVATILYAALGDPSMSKERVEVLGERGAGVLEDFRELQLHHGGKKQMLKSSRDKGHAAEMQAFIDACRVGRQPWPVSDMTAVMRATFAIRDALSARPALPAEPCRS